MSDGLKDRLNRLYTAHGRVSIRFRYALVAFDLVTIVYFVATAPYPETPVTKFLNLAIAVVIALDLAARFWIAPDRAYFLRRIYVIADVVVLASILLNPVFAVDLSFLRVLRGLRLVDSFHLLSDLRQQSAFFRRREDVIVAVINMTVFVLFCTSVVFTFFAQPGGGPTAYVDSLYFTVTTLTTTGYGDITPQTPLQKLAAVSMMIVGVSLFVHLARSIVMPKKVHHVCQNCGLSRHDPDAVHCKHCGVTVRIETTGAS